MRLPPTNARPALTSHAPLTTTSDRCLPVSTPGAFGAPAHTLAWCCAAAAEAAGAERHRVVTRPPASTRQEKIRRCPPMISPPLDTAGSPGRTRTVTSGVESNKGQAGCRHVEFMRRSPYQRSGMFPSARPEHCPHPEDHRPCRHHEHADPEQATQAAGVAQPTWPARAAGSPQARAAGATPHGSCRGRYHTDRHPGDVAEYTGSAPRAVDTLDSFTLCRQIRVPRQGHPHAAGVLRRSHYWREQVLFTILMSYRCYDMGCLGAPFCNPGRVVVRRDHCRDARDGWLMGPGRSDKAVGQSRNGGVTTGRAARLPAYRYLLRSARRAGRSCLVMARQHSGPAGLLPRLLIVGGSGAAPRR